MNKNTTVNTIEENAKELAEKAQKMLTETYSKGYFVYAFTDKIYLISVDNTITGTVIQHMQEVFPLYFNSVSTAYISGSTRKHLLERYPNMKIEDISIEAMFLMKEVDTQ